MSLVKQLTTVSEFDNWQTYFTMRRNDRDKSDWYAAATMQAIFASQGAKTKIEDHLLKFEAPKQETQKVEDSKSVWLAIFGIDPENP